MAILLIILKILLIILLVVLGIVLLVLIMPVGAEVSYIDGKLTYKVRLWLLNVMDSDGGGVVGWLKKRKKKPKKPKKPKPVKEKKQKKKKKSAVDDEAYLEDFDFDSDDFDESADEAVPETVAAETVSETVEEEKPDIPQETSAAPVEDKSDEEEDGLTDEDEKRSLSDWAELGIGVWESAQRPLLKIFKGFHFKNLYIDFVIADEDAYDCALKYGKYSGMIYNIIAFMSTLFTVRLKTVDVGCGFGLKKGKWDISCSIFFRAGTAVIAGLWFLITYLTRTFIPEKIRRFKRKKQRKSEV